MPTAVYYQLKEAGVSFWLKGERLCYRAGQRPLTLSELNVLKVHKTDIIRLVLEDALQSELDLERDKYQACLNVRKSPEYKMFSEITLMHEARAFARMEGRINELLHQLTLLRPRGD
jgi:hypothetical protein